MDATSDLFLHAVALHQHGNHMDAELLYQQILQADPLNFETLHHLGILAYQTGDHDRATVLLRQAIAVNPGADAVHFDLGVVLMHLQQFGEAIVCFQCTVRLNSRHFKAHLNLGNALMTLGHTAEAGMHYGQASRLDPNNADAHNNLGLALTEQGNLNEAAQCFRQTLAINFNDPDVHNNLGNVYYRQRKLNDAAASYALALRISPNHVNALCNLGNALKEQGLLGEAAEYYEKALTIDSTHSFTRWNRCLLHLLLGNFEIGWSEFEQRSALIGKMPRLFQQPRWDGAPLNGKALLIHAELGLGDTIQFLRFLPFIQKRGGTVYFECPLSLHKLLAERSGIDELVAVGQPLPPFDMHLPLLSLPGILGTTMSTIPASVPYLGSGAALVDFWRKELEELDGFKIGIAWQGNPLFPGDKLRSVPLVYFENLACIPDEVPHEWWTPS